MATITMTPSGGNEFWYPNGYPGAKPGDILVLPSGTWGLLQIGKMKGTSTAPIKITAPASGVATFSTIRIKDGNDFIVLTGKGSSTSERGIKSLGGLSYETSSNTILENLEVTNPGGVGIFARVVPDLADPRTIYPNFVLDGFKVLNCYVYNIGGEALYIGSTSPNGNDYAGSFQIPARMRNVEIAYNIIDGADWDGIQLSCAREGCSIHDNVVKNYGRINMGSQRAGIILGANTNGDVYRNTISNGTGNGIEIFGYGTIKVYDNVLDKCGLTAGEQSIIARDDMSTVETNPKQKVIITNNTINNPNVTADGIKVFNSFSNSEPAEITNNKFTVVNPPANWKMVVSNVPNSIISGNTLNASANLLPNVNAGVDQTITLPTNFVTLTGTATDGDGTIVAYKWSQVSGPTTATISSLSTPSTTVSNLGAGTYIFKLDVTDNLGGQASDMVSITVSQVVYENSISGSIINTTYAIPYKITYPNVSKIEIQFSKDDVSWDVIKSVTVTTKSGTLPYGSNILPLYTRTKVTLSTLEIKYSNSVKISLV